jgi:ATP-dependent Clp protease protease subunit
MDTNSIPLPAARNLYLPDQVTQKTMNSLTSSIISINNNDKYLKGLYKLHNIEYVAAPIKIYIDSYGGSVYQCFGLLGVMDKSETPIHTIVTGCAMSCGFMILISGHKRFGYELSTPLYHQVSTGFMGTVQDMEESLKETKRLQKMVEKITLNKTKITKKKLAEIMKNKVDWYMSAEEALNLGVVDKVI